MASLPPPPALALLVCAALLALFAAAVRALSRLDRRRRPALLAGAAGAGVLATGLGVALVALGGGLVSADLSTLALLGVAGVVAGADLYELAVAARLAWRTRRGGVEVSAGLGHADSLVAAGDLEVAARQLHDALELARAASNPELAWSALLRAAILDADLDRPAMARRHLGEAATVAQEKLSRQHLATVFAELAWIGYLFGDPPLAGVCLAWAGRAAGSIDPEGHFAADTTLLAAFLALAQGDLERAEAASNAVATLGDPDLVAGLEVARICLAYLQGWHDSARKVLYSAGPRLAQAHWRSRLVLPLVGLSLEARRRERPEDAAAIGRAAAHLAVKGGTMRELALLCADPSRDPDESTVAKALSSLMRGART